MNAEARRLVRDLVLFDKLHVERARLWRFIRIGVDRYRFTAERIVTDEKVPGQRTKRVLWHTYIERLDPVSWHPVPGTLERVGTRDSRNEAALDAYRAAAKLERPVKLVPRRRARRRRPNE